MTDYRDDIDNIIDWFDFERVHKVMTFLEWKWSSIGVPEIPELRQEARRLLKSTAFAVANSDLEESVTATGGFWASARKYPDSDKIYLSLSFSIAQWDNHD